MSADNEMRESGEQSFNGADADQNGASQGPAVEETNHLSSPAEAEIATGAAQEAAAEEAAQHAAAEEAAPAAKEAAAPPAAKSQAAASDDEDDDESEGDEDALAVLPTALRRAMEKKGYFKLTQVQIAVAQGAEAHRDLRISSQTGSGKTVALGIALGRALLDDGPRERGKRGEPQEGATALVLAPTRELAIQVQRELVWLLSEIEDAFVEVVTGGTSVGLDRKHLSKKPRIVVGTPGRVLDHLNTKVLDAESIKHVILDEADQMLDMGFRDELEGIINFLPQERHTHLVSATFGGEVLGVADAFQTDPMHLEGTALGQANADIQHIAHIIPHRSRYDALLNVLLLASAEQLSSAAPEGSGPSGRTLVFVKTRAETTEVAERLCRDGLHAEALSGDLAQNQRIRTLEAFRSGRVNILVATDVAARGIDVKGIDCVVHYEPPQNGDAFVHRSGRTGRAGQQGKSLMFLPPQARGRVERMMRTAKVQPRFAPIPTPDKIAKAYSKVARRRLYQAFENAAVPDQIEHAKKLLEETEAVEIISRLLEMVDEKPPCRPREVVTIAEGSLHADRGFGRGGRPGGRGGPRGRRDGGFDRGPRGGRDGGYDRGPRGPRPPRDGDFGASARGPREGGYDRGPREGGFDRGSREGSYDRGPRRGGFDRGPREGGYDRGPRGGGFDRGPREGGFDRAPRAGGFDRGPQGGGFDRGSRFEDRSPKPGRFSTKRSHFDSDEFSPGPRGPKGPGGPKKSFKKKR